ncbi:MAG TPA: DUF4331 domain-containing protein [Acidimicrobiales bacterium]|nr:DUF4331 domain-containing protein [Acidimicrobiales bacterium]
MSSHREAPQISKDPTADSTDVYAFVSPDLPHTVTLIANYIPLEQPGGGPNFYEFADDVLYRINIDNDGDGDADISYEFRFETVNAIPESFLYNDGPITALTGAGASLWNRRQTYSLARVDHGSDERSDGRTQLGTGMTAPPCNIGPLSTPNYASLAQQAIHSFSEHGFTGTVFAGQRAEGFYVDLGAVFDLGGLRPFEAAHLSKIVPNMPGVNSSAAVNVHTLALQIPIDQLTANRRRPNSTIDPHAVIGVWTDALRQKAKVRDDDGRWASSGPFSQVSRLGNPLVNELIIGIGDKDRWNALPPTSDGTRFGEYFANPLLGQLLPTLYSGVFPNLAAYNTAHAGDTTLASPARPDLVAILISGIPQSVLSAAGLGGVVPPTNVGGTGVADLLRLNVAQPPSQNPNIFGYLGGDPAGFPNGRRVFDDVATIELRAVAGATLPLVATFTPDAAVGSVGTDPKTVISFGLTNGNDPTALGTENYLTTFPYLGTPYSGYATPSKTPTDKAS